MVWLLNKVDFDVVIGVLGEETLFLMICKYVKCFTIFSKINENFQKKIKTWLKSLWKQLQPFTGSLKIPPVSLVMKL